MSAAETPASGASTPPNGHEKDAAANDYAGNYPPVKVLNFQVITMGLLVSLGGFIFGWEGGSISGYTQMANFREHFGDTQKNGVLSLGNVRQGLMVAMLCAGCLVGALVSAPIADNIGRKFSITFWCIVYIVGNIVCITTTDKWYQIVIGRLIDGFGIGALSVLTPMYQSETAPRQARGALVSAYQLFITLGIFVAYCVNYGTEAIKSESSWRITMGVGFIAPAIMGAGMLTMRESPRWQYRRGGEAEAAQTLALISCVSADHPEVQHELAEIREKYEAEVAGGDPKWYEIFTAPAMLRRVLVGMALQALQQLTGANFFFYYGTQIFASVGISNSYITSMILGAVNVFSTFGGLYVGQKFGRRISMIIGGVWMFIWLIIFASLGSFALYPDGNPNDPNARTNSSVGSAMIASACFFIVGFAVTVSSYKPHHNPAQCIFSEIDSANPHSNSGDLLSGPSSVKCSRPVTVPSPWRSAPPPTGCGTSSSPSSPPGSLPPSATATATSSPAAVSSVSSSPSSSSTSPRAAPSRRLTPCTSWASSPGSPSPGSPSTSPSPPTGCTSSPARATSPSPRLPPRDTTMVRTLAPATLSKRHKSGERACGLMKDATTKLASGVVRGPHHESMSGKRII